MAEEEVELVRASEVRAAQGAGEGGILRLLLYCPEPMVSVVAAGAVEDGVVMEL
jgi:hypothetical protein